MIPKSPKQAYCTKFLLNTRMQPAGTEKGGVRGLGVRPEEETPPFVPGPQVWQEPKDLPQTKISW